MASMDEQRMADENVLRLVEELKKRDMEIVGILQLMISNDEKREMEIEGLKEKLQKQELEIEELKEKLQQKEEEMDSLANLTNSLIEKERKSNRELQEARIELITGSSEMLIGRTEIGLKRMGEIDEKPFQNKFEERSDADLKATKLCSFWQKRVQNSRWHPFKIVQLEGGNHEEIINEDDKWLKDLKARWGVEIYEAVTTALKEMKEYNASGGYIVYELWNFEEKRRATLKEVIAYILKKDTD